MTTAIATATTQVLSLTPRFHEQWDAYIAAAQGATVAHNRAWAAVVHETFGHQIHHLLVMRHNRVVGVLPLVRITSPWFGRSLVSSPYLTYGGLLADDVSAARALVAAAAHLADECRARHVEIRNHIAWPANLHNKTCYQTMCVNLKPGPDALWHNHLHASARRNVRLAEKAGLRVRSGRHHLPSLISIITHNMRRLGTPAHGRRFFEKILSQFPEAILLIVEDGDQPIGGALLIGHGDTLEMPWSASLDQHFKNRPNDLLYWHAIRAACDAGYHRLDLGRSKPDSGTWRFKSRFAAAPQSLVYQYHLAPREPMPEVDPDNPRYRPLIAAWRRLPLPVVRTLGPRLIAAIP